MDDGSRIRLATYIASLMVRGPRWRAKAREMFPDVLQSSASRIRKQWEQWAASSDADHALVALGFAKIETAESKFAVDPPSEVVGLICSPESSPFLVETLHGS